MAGLLPQGFLSMLRPANLILLAFIQYVVFYGVIMQDYPSDLPLPMTLSDITLLVAMTLCAAGGGYIVNDFYDRQADAVNRPGRNVLGTVIPENMAWITYTIVSTVGLYCAYYVTVRTGKNMLLLYGFTVVVLWSYSAYFQRLPLVGNVLVATVCAIAVFLPWLVQPGLVQLEVRDKGLIIFFYSVFAFFITLIREIVKDAEDIEGDRQTGSYTIPVLFGEGVARVVGLAVILCTLGVMAYWLRVKGLQSSFLSQVYFAALICLPLLYILIALFRARTSKSYGRISTYLKFLILSGTIYIVLI